MSLYGKTQYFLQFKAVQLRQDQPGGNVAEFVQNLFAQTLHRQKGSLDLSNSRLSICTGPS